MSYVWQRVSLCIGQEQYEKTTVGTSIHGPGLREMFEKP